MSKSTSFSRRLRIGMLTAMLVWSLVAVTGTTRSALALDSGSGPVIGHGFDTCQDPNEGQMQAWWNSTPWWFVGLYIGGSNIGCSQPNLGAQYLNDLRSQGWRFGFFWVGPQAPCSAFGSQFSSDPGTAFTQGQNEAVAAYQTLLNLGVANSAANTPVTYDLEAFNGGQCNAQAAANSFIDGWDYQLHVPTAQAAGVYGSTCGSSLDSYAFVNNKPNFIWGASYDGNQSTSALPCVDSGHWIYSQRFKQYVGGHNETWNGVTLNIDTNCGNGPGAPNSLTADTSCE